MASSQVIEDILEAVHRLSGRPVLVQAEPGLKTMATVRAAKGSAPAHLIRYNPSASSFADYLVAFQCGFLLRTFSLPESERFEVGAAYWGKREAEKLVNEHIRQAKLPLNKEARVGLTTQIVDGLIIQLRSVPIGMRVDRWIMDKYPDLGEKQRVSIERQIQEGLGALAPNVKQIAPELIYNGNVGMNAAFAAFWARAWGEVPLTTPYKLGFPSWTP
ncbi:MAG: hypothetical protein NTW19_01335, partial [Planctomycetota bacterium]|nr:hypothetical protein [Planctomycetota bacterium]